MTFAGMDGGSLTGEPKPPGLMGRRRYQTRVDSDIQQAVLDSMFWIWLHVSNYTSRQPRRPDQEEVQGLLVENRNLLIQIKVLI
jgi:hypothetical protein